MANQVWRQVRQPDGTMKLELQMDTRPQWLKDQVGAFGSYTVQRDYGMDPATMGAIPESARVIDPRTGQQITPQATGPVVPQPARTVLGGFGEVQPAVAPAAAGPMAQAPAAQAAAARGTQVAPHGVLPDAVLRVTGAASRFGAGRSAGSSLLGRR